MGIMKPKFGLNAKHWCAALAIVGAIVLTLAVMQPNVSTQATSSADAKSLSPSLPSTANLTLIALNDTEYVWNSSQIAALPSTTGQGGLAYGSQPFKTNNYTGVSLKTLASLIGGMNNSEVLMVQGSDGYTINFTYSQVMNGNFSTWNGTGVPTTPTKPIVPIVAYYNNSQPIPAKSDNGSGPLMVAIVGNESLVTEGKYWVKWVDKIEVSSATSVPEFSAVTLAPLFAALTLIAVVSSVWLGRKYPKNPFLQSITKVHESRFKTRRFFGKNATTELFRFFEPNLSHHF
jgi:hypothetical protein